VTKIFAPVTLPSAVEAALDRGAALAISISGGKDSQAMLNVMADLHRTRGWTGDLVALHADLGRVEWQGQADIPGFRSASEHVAKMAADAGVRLVVVRRTDGQDMLDRWAHRQAQLEGTGKPFWSSAKERYCTSDMKRDPMDSWVRQHYQDVVVCEGLRAQESTARAKKARWEVRKRITTRTRRALTWRPIFDWNVLQVWRAIGVSWALLDLHRQRWNAGDTTALADWPAAPAYVLGNDRLSCAMCVLGSKSDLVNGARWNPDTWAAMRALEIKGNATFRMDISLEQVGQLAGLAPFATLEQAA